VYRPSLAWVVDLRVIFLAPLLYAVGCCATAVGSRQESGISCCLAR
jgi:hypothetical protein